MGSQSRINNYMERHKISAIFEDLMNKVVRDMPEEPMIYLIRAMYKKAGMEIPQGIRFGGLRKSTSDLVKSVSPERQSRTAHVANSADLEMSRDYDRPWATSPTRRTKPKKSEELTLTKKRPDWNPDNKTKISTFDEMWETKKESGQQVAAVRKSMQKSGAASTNQGVNAWASVGLDEKETYTSPSYQVANKSKPTSFSEKNLLELETLRPSVRSVNQPTQQSSSISKSHKIDPRKHKEEYSRLLSEIDRKSDDSGLGGEMVNFSGDNEDDAIELLENADDLRKEGVKNISTTGYKLSRNLQYRENEPRVKLNINVHPMPQAFSYHKENVRYIDEFDTEISSPDLRESDDEEEEFESVSQVSGPRHPVWNLPDSETETKKKRSANVKLPSGINDLFELKTDRVSGASNKSAESRKDQVWKHEISQVTFNPTKVEHRQSPSSVYSDGSSRGWVIPDDTEAASAYDWNKRVKGGPRQDPRAY